MVTLTLKYFSLRLFYKDPLKRNTFRLYIEGNLWSARPQSFFQLSYKLDREENCDATYGIIIGYRVNTFFSSQYHSCQACFILLVLHYWIFCGILCRPQVASWGTSVNLSFHLLQFPSSAKYSPLIILLFISYYWKKKKKVKLQNMTVNKSNSSHLYFIIPTY